MSEFLTRMVERQRGELPTVQPSVPPRYAAVGERTSASVSAEETTLRPPVTRSQAPLTMEPQSIGMSQEESEFSAASPTSTVMKADNERPNMSHRLSSPVPESFEAARPPVIERVPSVPPVIQERVVAPRLPVKVDRVSLETSLRYEQAESNERVPQIKVPDLPSRLLTARHESHRQNIRAPRSLVMREGVDRPESLESSVIEPSVTVTIGRVEVTTLSAPATPKRNGAARQPAMSLQDYLSRRQRRST